MTIAAPSAEAPAATPAAGFPPQRWRERHTIAWLVLQRSAYGLVTLLAVSIIVFWATEILPGNAARAILGQTATPERIRALTLQLHLNRGIVDQYWTWLSAFVTGNFGHSYANQLPVWAVVKPRLINSAVLVVCAGVIGSVLGVISGALCAVWRDSWFDTSLSTAALAVTSLPEFVVGIALVVLLATVVWHVFPAVSFLPPGTYAWSAPKELVLPILTLVIVITPYILRMTRAATVEALESEYVEMARLKGAKPSRVLFRHALPNAVAPTIQVIGINFLYLAGGIVVVENLFAYPGIGQGLVQAVGARDVPVIQCIVVILAAFYVVVNIATDVIALIASPRRRFPR